MEAATSARLGAATGSAAAAAAAVASAGARARQATSASARQATNVCPVPVDRCSARTPTPASPASVVLCSGGGRPSTPSPASAAACCLSRSQRYPGTSTPSLPCPPTANVKHAALLHGAPGAALKTHSPRVQPRDASHQRQRQIRVSAASASPSSPSSPSDRGRKASRWDPLLANSDVGCPVPPEQQPVNEYSDLADSFFFDWAPMGPLNLSLRLGAIGLFFTTAVGWPIACASFDPHRQALQCVLSAIGGGLFPVTLATTRLYLGWAYVSNRLASATVEYEETGWYDGQVWVKTPELLARDRLLSSYRIKPVLRKLQNVLIGLGLSLVLVFGLVSFLPPYVPDPEPSPLASNTVQWQAAGPTRQETTYDPDAAQRFEGSFLEGEGAGAAGLSGLAAADASSEALFLRFHALGRLHGESERDGDAGGEESVVLEEPPVEARVLAPVSILPHGTSKYLYGFEYLAANKGPALLVADQGGAAAGLLEADDDSLYSRGEARDVAEGFSALSDVVIVGLRERITHWTEESFDVVEGEEDLMVLGAGVRPSTSTRGVGTARISDHLSVGADGEMGVLRSLKNRPLTD